MHNIKKKSYLWAEVIPVMVIIYRKKAVPLKYCTIGVPHKDEMLPRTLESEVARFGLIQTGNNVVFVVYKCLYWK